MKTSYNPAIVTAFFKEQGIRGVAYFEYKFSHDRKWRFDVAFPWNYVDTPIVTVKEGESISELAHRPLAIEVQGGIWSAGRHNRGAAMLKEWEKLNTAACLGWRILYCQPSELCTVAFANTIKRALNL